MYRSLARPSGRAFLPVLLLLIAAAGCAKSNGASGPASSSQEAPARRSVRVETLVLQPTAFEDVIEITGTVVADDDATLSAQAAGTVVSLAELGRPVQAGQVVAQLDAGLVRAAVQQAEAQVAAAQAQFELTEDNLKRQQPLYRDSVISALEFENVRARYNQALAQLQQAKAGLTQAQEQLRNTRVVAPFSGVVEERLVEQGEQVTPGRAIVRVVSTRRVKVRAGVPERYAGDVTRGTPVQIDFQSLGLGRHLGRVTFVGSAVDPQNRTFPIEVELDNREGRLKPQMVAKLYVTRAQMTDVLVVPRNAIVRDETGNSLFAVERRDSMAAAARRDVVLGPAYGDRVVIVAGLRAGDEVVVLGQNNLTSGDALQVVEQHRSLSAPGLPGTPDETAASAE